MQTQIAIDSGGNIYGTTTLKTSNWGRGFHGMVVVTFFDFTGNIIPALQAQVAQRIGMDEVFGDNQNKPIPNAWTANIGTSYLQQIRSVTISHVYSPNSLEQDFSAWFGAIGQYAQDLLPLAQIVGSVAGAAGGGKGKSAG